VVSEDLVTWLRAQIDEDQWHAEELRRSRWSHVDFVTSRGSSTWRCIDPDRLLAEVEAKGRILDEIERAEGACLNGRCDPIDADRIVRLLAHPYADRDGYRREWRGVVSYVEVEPTFTIHRDRGIWWAEVQYATWKGQPETYESKTCFTPWGARRVGRRECERIRREREFDRVPW
jgi:hypothetical protein